MNRVRNGNPAGHFAERMHPHQLSLLQQLIAHVRAGVPHPGPHPAGGVPHGFGPGGAVTGDGHYPGEFQPAQGNPLMVNPGGGSLSPALAPFASHLGQGHMLPSQILRGLGNPAAAAALWMQHHPGAMQTGRFMPSWVTPYLPGAQNSPTPQAPQAY